MHIQSTDKTITQKNYQWYKLAYVDDQAQSKVGEFGIDSNNGDVLNVDGVSLNDRGDKIDLFIIGHLQTLYS